MNRSNLQSIFKKYIDNFEVLNNKTNDETYKWEIVQKFRDFDVDAEDFVGVLSSMWKTSANLIDSSHQLPFYALVEYSKKESGTVREMFRKLYAEEHLDYKAKQKLIDEFIESSEELRAKYFPNSHLFKNNQRSVMMYLFLRYPDSNYAYKAAEAKSFADCIEFYDDWGPMSDFRLDVFGRMCDELISEIRKNDALMKTHQSRFENTDRVLYSDNSLHILAFDIIYSSQAYDFYGDITFEPITAQARKLYFERVAKAKELAETVKKRRDASDRLAEAKKYIEEHLARDAVIEHKTYGKGTVTKCGLSVLEAYFPKINETKKFGLVTVIETNLIGFDPEEVTEKVRSYIPIIKNERRIEDDLKKAEEALKPYLEYLD